MIYINLYGWCSLLLYSHESGHVTSLVEIREMTVYGQAIRGPLESLESLEALECHRCVPSNLACVV